VAGIRRVRNCPHHNLVINRGLAEIVTPERKLEEPILTPLIRLREACEKVTLRVQEQGIVRADLTWRDVILLSRAAACTAPHVGVVGSEDQWRRTLTILLDGLRSPTTEHCRRSATDLVPTSVGRSALADDGDGGGSETTLIPPPHGGHDGTNGPQSSLRTAMLRLDGLDSGSRGACRLATQAPAAH